MRTPSRLVFWSIALFMVGCGQTESNRSFSPSNHQSNELEDSHQTARSPADSLALDENVLSTLSISRASSGSISFEPGLFNPTCGSKKRHLALDLDGDGTVNHFTDGALLTALATVGTTLDKKKPFIQQGNRTDIDLYYHQILKPRLDVDGDGKVSLFRDIAVISTYMLHETMPTEQLTDMLKKFKVNEKKLKTLFAETITCNFSTSYQLDAMFDLKKPGSFSEDWGGKGNLWFWSAKHKAWLFVGNDSHLRLWDRKSGKKSTGQSFGRIEPYYRSHPDQFVNLVELVDETTRTPSEHSF